MLEREQRETAMASAIEMATLDLKTNGAYTNAPYTILVDGVYLKARVRHSEHQGDHVIRLELYQPETNVGSHELKREPSQSVKIKQA